MPPTGQQYLSVNSRGVRHYHIIPCCFVTLIIKEILLFLEVKLDPVVETHNITTGLRLTNKHMFKATGVLSGQVGIDFTKRKKGKKKFHITKWASQVKFNCRPLDLLLYILYGSICKHKCMQIIERERDSPSSSSSVVKSEPHVVQLTLKLPQVWLRFSLFN